MPLDRRQFMRAAGLGFLTSLNPFQAEALADSDELFASACRKADGAFALAILDVRGRIVRLVDLPARGHDVVRHRESDLTAIFARRPGTFALVIGRRSEPHIITAAEGRHFYGHGAFSPDGRLLYATENDFDAARGVIGIYDVANGFARIGEFHSHGVGPHEMLLTEQGRVMAVANGGIETHPDFGRSKLNLETMRPSLAMIDAQTGDLIERHVLPEHRHHLSIRHMGVGDDGAIWFGGQDQSGAQDPTQPIGHARRGEDIELASLPDDARRALRGYVGSVAMDRARGLIGFSSPVGHAVVVLEAATGRVARVIRRESVSGLAAGHDGLLASSGEGAVFAVNAPDRAAMVPVLFDNHLRFHS